MDERTLADLMGEKHADDGESSILLADAAKKFLIDVYKIPVVFSLGFKEERASIATIPDLLRVPTFASC